MEQAAKVLLGRLFEKTSAKGRTYFTGRLGAARCVMLKDERAEGTDPVWQIFVQDGDSGPRPETCQKPADGPFCDSGVIRQRKSRQRTTAANGRAARAYRDCQAPLDRDGCDDLDMPLPDDMR